MLSRWSQRVGKNHRLLGKHGDVSQHSRQLINAGICTVAGKATRAEGNTEVEAAKVMLAFACLCDSNVQSCSSALRFLGQGIR